MTFTIGRGNDIVCEAIRQVAKKLVGKSTEELFADMGKTWSWITAGKLAFLRTLSSLRMANTRFQIHRCAGGHNLSRLRLHLLIPYAG